MYQTKYERHGLLFILGKVVEEFSFRSIGVERTTKPPIVADHKPAESPTSQVARQGAGSDLNLFGGDQAFNRPENP